MKWVEGGDQFNQHKNSFLGHLTWKSNLQCQHFSPTSPFALGHINESQVQIPVFFPIVSRLFPDGRVVPWRLLTNLGRSRFWRKMKGSPALRDVP